MGLILLNKLAKALGFKMRAVYVLDESRHRGPSSPQRVRLLKLVHVRRLVVEDFEAS